MMAYRSTIHASTKYTSFYLLFGKQMLYPIEYLIGLPVEEQRQEPQSYVDQLQHNLVTAYEIVRSNLKETQLRQKKYFNESAHSIVAKPGDIIFVRNQNPKAFQSH